MIAMMGSGGSQFRRLGKGALRAVPTMQSNLESFRT
jgi:hypothetical protein